MKPLITLSHLLLIAVLAQAQYSVKKIDINKTGPLSGSRPHAFVEYKGRVYFTADDGIHGRELWWSDGETAGMVADIHTGSGGSFNDFSELCVVKGNLYFSAYDGQYGDELWVFNGIGPAQPAARIDPVGFNYLRGLTELKDKLYFIGSDGTGDRLWEYDPDSAWNFTADSITGSKGWYEFSQTPAVFKGRIVVHAEIDPAVGRELYQYIPGQGFILVTDIFPGSGSSAPKSMYVFGDKLFFLAKDPQYGYELYVWDGVNPVKRLTDIVKGPGDSFYTLSGSVSEGTELHGYNNKLYFSVWDDPSLSLSKFDIYTYDLSSGAVKKQMPMQGNSPGQNFVTYGGRLYFTSHTNLYPNSSGSFVYDGVLGLSDFGAAFSPMLYMNGPGKAINKLFFSSVADSGGDYELHVLTDVQAVAVPELVNANEVKVYPNPVSDKATISFTLKLAATVNIQLTDLQGRVVYTTDIKRYSAGKHQIKMPVQDLAAGNYIYSVMSDRGEILGRSKLVKE